MAFQCLWRSEQRLLKVFLISPNRLTTPAPVYPIGLDYVAGAIPPQHDVKIFDLNQEQAPEALPTSLLAFNPDLVGISIRNIDNTDGANSRSYIEEYRAIVRTIRNNSKAPIVLGGSGFTIFPRILMDLLDADYGIPGDGERIGLLLEALERHTDVENVTGLMTRKNSFQENSGILTLPMQRRFDTRNTHLQYYLKRSSMMNLQTKRGCPFQCIYCTYPAIDGSRLRLHDPAVVARSALALQEAGAQYLFITDSTFNSSVRHSMDVAKAFMKIGLSIPWTAFFAPTAVPNDYFQLMAEAGLSHIEFGTESLSDKMLASYKKPFTTADVFRAHLLARKAGIHIAHYLMPGGPGENEETLEETLINAESLAKAVFFFFCGIRIYPRTPLYDIALHEGQITPDQDLLSPIFYQSAHLSHALIEEKILAKAAGRVNWVIGSGGKTMERIMSRMFTQGHVGPLWEHLVS